MKIRKANVADAPGIFKVHIDSWRSTYRGIVPHNYLDRMSYEERTNRWLGILNTTQNVYDAENESGEIIGFAKRRKRAKQSPQYKGCFL